MKNNLLYRAVLPALLSLSGAASAITEPTVVDFGYKPNRSTPDTVLTEPAYYGNGNISPNADGTCTNGACVYQNGMVISTVIDTTSDGAHLHRAGVESDRKLAYHEDSGGFYIRAQDSSPFALTSLEIFSPYKTTNPYSAFLEDGVTPNPEHDPSVDFFEILGFSDAINPDLSSGDGTNYANRVAYQTIQNGHVGEVLLNSDFLSVSSVWIHYFGVPNVESAVFAFDMQVDNINVAPPAAVPIPAAVWLFASGIAGLISFGRKKSAQLVA